MVDGETMAKPCWSRSKGGVYYMRGIRRGNETADGVPPEVGPRGTAYVRTGQRAKPPSPVAEGPSRTLASAATQRSRVRR
jgi:hypothetical protein